MRNLVTVKLLSVFQLMPMAVIRLLVALHILESLILRLLQLENSLFHKCFVMKVLLEEMIAVYLSVW